MRIAIAILGLLATAALFTALKQPLADIPSAGLLNLHETKWGGGGRLWLAIAFAFLSAVFVLALRTRTVAAIFAGLALGMLTDLAFSGQAERAEMAALAASMGGTDVEQKITWKVGSDALAAAGCFLLAQVLLLAYPARQSKAPAA
jgi:hypothetical protein